MTRRLRIYIDTSVFGGYYDPEFREVTRKLFAEIKAGRFWVLVSPIVVKELQQAPEAVRNLLLDLPDEVMEAVPLTEDAIALRDAYIAAGVVTKKSLDDATHIAIASVARADLIVSWNFKHIVHFDKIRGYHAINIREGYSQVPIHSPREVVKP